MKPFVLLYCLVCTLLSALAGDHQKHLFILSGQSNMQGHRPDEVFTPMVQEALGRERVIVIQDALGGQPIHRWWKEWRDPKGEKPNQIGDLYDRLMEKVNAGIEGHKIKTVCFVWMQGERDAKMGWGKLYEKALLGLHSQLAKDLNLRANDLGFVIGRLSDFDISNKRYPHWTMVREAQERVANSSKNFFLVNTDDLNDGLSRKGKTIKDDLHYSAEGYKILGKRFAEFSIKTIRN